MMNGRKMSKRLVGMKDDGSFIHETHTNAVWARIDAEWEKAHPHDPAFPSEAAPCSEDDEG